MPDKLQYQDDVVLVLVDMSGRESKMPAKLSEGQSLPSYSCGVTETGSACRLEDLSIRGGPVGLGPVGEQIRG